MAYLTNLARSEGDPKVVRSGPSSLGAADQMARALGWFSIGLGLTELIAPGKITRALGMEGKENLVRAYGAREVAQAADRRAKLKARAMRGGIGILPMLQEHAPIGGYGGGVQRAALALPLMAFPAFRLVVSPGAEAGGFGAPIALAVVLERRPLDASRYTRAA